MFRLLMIEDDAMMRHMFVKTMTHEGFEVLAEGTLSLGGQTAREKKPDLILLDVHLPDGNGIEFCAKLKADPMLRHIPVLLLSGEATDVSCRVDGIEAGAEDYVTKPFDHRELVSRIKNLLRSASGPTLK
ncbi:MAG: response regulator [Elusimicrobiota bacterium]|jgi:DNA-binding response OmpR family regulator